MRAMALMSLLLILSAIPAAHADKPLNYGDFKWRQIAGDRSFATSKCIGDTSSIDCLIDTLMACFAWSEHQTPDIEYDTICETLEDPFLSVALSYGLVAYPWTATGWFYYYTDTYYVLPGRRTRPVPQSETAAVERAINVDLYVLACYPEKQCAREVGGDRPASEILARCPRTRCFGDPHRNTTFGAVFPRHSYTIERTGDTWRLLEHVDHIDNGSVPVDPFTPQQKRPR